MEVGQSYLGVLTYTRLSKATPAWIVLSHTDLGSSGVVRRPATDSRAVASTFEGKSPQAVGTAVVGQHAGGDVEMTRPGVLGDDLA